MALVVGTNAYITVIDADTYFADRLFTDPWNTALAEDKSRALIMATQRIDRLRYAGEKAGAAAQVLQFPRKFYPLPGLSFRGVPYGALLYEYTETVVPDVVKQAACEEALALLDYANNHRIRLQHQGVSAFTTDDGIHEAFSNARARGTKTMRKLFSDEAVHLLAPFLAVSVPISSGRYPW